MPTLHRLACFRDDVIFVIYLYQMYMYKVDKSRVNEYGQGGDADEKRTESVVKRDTPANPSKESKKTK